jgi:hypothetical protein
MSIRVTIAASLVPQQGTPGDIWIPQDCRKIFVVGDNSKTIDITAALDGGLFQGLSVTLIHEVNKLGALVDEFIAQNKTAADYVEHLREKVKRRKQ